MAEVEQGAQAPQREATPSFAERKAAQLRQERAANPPEENIQPDPAPQRTTEPELESADEINPESGLTDEQDEFEDEDELTEAPEEGITEEDDPELEREAQVDWKKQFEETKRKLSQVTENRTAMEQEHADMMAANLTLRHGLEDSFTEAKRYAGSFKAGFDQQIMQLEQAFSTGQIEPDNLPAARQHYQTLVNQRNALVQQVEQIHAQEAEAKRVERERKAEIARVRLSRTIPNWSREKHRELGEYAMQRGYSADEFNESLDYRFLELLNDSMQLKQAGSTVKGLRRQRKAGSPRRDAKPLMRSADGKFKKAQKDFHENPNQRGRFAEMKLRQLEKERRR